MENKTQVKEMQKKQKKATTNPLLGRRRGTPPKNFSLTCLSVIV
jgi:hypothetical protein